MLALGCQGIREKIYQYHHNSNKNKRKRKSTGTRILNSITSLPAVDTSKQHKMIALESLPSQKKNEK